MKIEYLIPGLVVFAILLFVNQENRLKKIEKKQKKEMHEEQSIRYWVPGHLTSYYYPFDVLSTFRRHHRFHGSGYRYH